MAETERKIKGNFTLIAIEGTPDGALVKYYQQLGQREARKRLLEAAAAFWSPLAARAAGRNGESLRCLVTDCLYRLRRQERELAAQFLGSKEETTLATQKPPSGGKKVIFRLTYQVYEANQANLVRFLMEEGGNFSRLQKVLWSSRAFWGASAEREVGQLDAEQLSRRATHCVRCLRDHIDYLKNYFQYWEIDDRIAASASGPAVPTLAATSPVPPLLEEEKREEETEEETKVMSDEEMEQWLRHDPENDGWRSNLFN
jgi:hypothetical protein